jgi:hypothetical protein
MNAIALTANALKNRTADANHERIVIVVRKFVLAVKTASVAMIANATTVTVSQSNIRSRV